MGRPRGDAARRRSAAVADDAELVTCIAGDGAPLDGDAIERARARRASSSSYHEGGQPAWWWLLAAE